MKFYSMVYMEKYFEIIFASIIYKLNPVLTFPLQIYWYHQQINLSTPHVVGLKFFLDKLSAELIT